MFAYVVGLQVVFVVKERVANVALVPGQLAALVSGVPAQRVSVLVQFAARAAGPRVGGHHIWKNDKNQNNNISALLP